MKCLTQRKKTATPNQGFTLVELMIASAILIITIVGILISYIRCLELAEMSRNTSTALNATRSRIEQIKNTDFAQLVATYNTTTFTTPGLNGIGVSYVTAVNPDLMRITVTFCWRQKTGRIIGEDTNLNGVLNAGEDANGNGILDSKVQLVSQIFQR